MMKQKSEMLEQGKQMLKKQWDQGATVTIKGKTLRFRPVRVVAIVLLAILALILLIKLISIPLHRPRTVALDFETGGNYSLQAMDDSILMYNKQHIMALDTRGKTRWQVDIPLSEPVVEHAGDYVLAVDLGGNHYVGLYKHGEKIQEINVGADIISAKVNKDGVIAIASAAVGYKGKVTVYDKKGREKYNWNSGDKYISDIALHDNGRYLAVAQVLSDGEQTNSSILFLDTHKQEPVAEAEKQDALIGELRYIGNRLIAISDKEFSGYKTGGKQVYTVSLAGKNPSKYDISGDELLSFVTTDNRGNAVLELYRPDDGKLCGSFRAQNAIRNMAVCGDMAVLSDQREIICINSRGKVKKQVTAPQDIKTIGIFNDGDTVISVGSNSAYLLWTR